jgi:hypothetical protein
MDLKPLYAELVFRAENILTHWVEDLEVHDKKTLHSKVQPGQMWLWQVRPTGTWLVRWDEDAAAGTKDSMVETLIRSGQRGNWMGAEWYLVHCKEIRNGQPYGLVSNAIPVDDLAECLPRPKPSPVLPGERRYVCAGVR